jgi:hypothetical protein
MKPGKQEKYLCWFLISDFWDTSYLTGNTPSAHTELEMQTNTVFAEKQQTHGKWSDTSQCG